MYRVDMSQRPADILRGLVNFDNGTEFNASNLSFNPKGASPLPHREAVNRKRNSKVMAYFKGSHRGQRLFHFNRIDLNAFFGNICAGAPYGVHTRTTELLPYVRKDLGIDIAEDEVLDEYLDPEAAFVDIQILRNSLTYIGSVRVYFLGAPGSLVDKVRSTTLGGFTSENSEGN
tara:strand:- start:566 stop:1087 length:522 start_codon:yes stop_codon:yes gene_type:complete